MPNSQNGWAANNVALTASQFVPGTQVKLRVRMDAPGQLLLEVASAFDRLVEDIDNARGALDDWGYAARPIRGGSTLSNHASGTAIDLNAPRHPLGTNPTDNFTPAQIQKIHEIVAVTGHAVRWGGDYSGRKDPMHFEINDGVTLERCAQALVRIRAFNGRGPGISQPSPPPTPAPPSGRRVLSVTTPLTSGPDVAELQRVLSRWYPVMRLTVDGVYGPATARAVRHLQAQAEIMVDGIAGPATFRELGMTA